MQRMTSMSAPVLLSQLLEWASSTTRSDSPRVKQCKEALNNAVLRQEELQNGCCFCMLTQQIITKCFLEHTRNGGTLGWTMFSYRGGEHGITDGVNNYHNMHVNQAGEITSIFGRDENSRRLVGPLIKRYGEIPVPKRIIPCNTSSSASLKCVKSWIEQCVHKHLRCGGDSPRKLPTRVIDVGHNIHSIRLLETKGRIGNYACLTHSWGKRHLLRTVKANLVQMAENIPWNELPKTFQDAIDFTRRLGLRWIWIDSLCIVQDDVLDWQREAAQMADVYQHARVTLAASIANDSAGGLYTSEEDEAYFRQHELSITNDVDESPFALFVGAEIKHLHHGLFKFSILRRAWCFQERLLSARIVHFAGPELIWECRSEYKCECGEASLTTGVHLIPPKIMFTGHLVASNNRTEQDFDFSTTGKELHDPNSGGKFNLTTSASQLLESFSDVGKSSAWRQVVQKYTHLKLTYPSDVFPALAGIARVWATNFSGQYLAGLWRETLLEDLCWHAVKAETRAEPWRAPTWSWASLVWNNQALIQFDPDKHQVTSTKGSYCFHKDLTFDDSEKIAEVVEAECLPIGIDPYGQLQSGFIILKTHALSGTLLHWPYTTEILPRHAQRLQLVVGDMWFRVGNEFDRGFMPDVPLAADEAAFLTPVHIIHIMDLGVRWGEEKNKPPDMACLVLRQTSTTTSSETVEYERIGYLRILPWSISTAPKLPEATNALDAEFVKWYEDHRKEVKHFEKERQNEVQWFSEFENDSPAMKKLYDEDRSKFYDMQYDVSTAKHEHAIRELRRRFRSSEQQTFKIM